MIVNDWTLAHIALQIITEEGLGHNVRQAKAAEDAQMAQARKGVKRGPR